ncbi:uncharacterized protein V2V93DRAFT_162221 [Kockiozyma suomiensis]|uniref:uncharacterized protein n=1 Tax=Kockiozyma suomiensis TaxID=1337062 RepID=UPI0033434E3B
MPSIVSEEYPALDVDSLVASFLGNLPKNPTAEGASSSTDDILIPHLTPTFLGLLSPLLRARLSYNIESFTTGDKTDHHMLSSVIESVTSQWAAMLSWSSSPSSGPVLARRLYDAANNEAIQVSTSGIIKPDIETVLVRGVLVDHDVVMTWTWEATENAWRVHEVSYLADSTAVENDDEVDLDQEDEEDSYWDEYDRKLAEQEDQQQQPEHQPTFPTQSTTPNKDQTNSDDEYYSRYESVETMVVSDDPQQQMQQQTAQTDQTGENAAVLKHLDTSIKSLFALSKASGISKEKFLGIVNSCVE